ncbi:MAG: tetrahydrofolate dehydrogenase/cyclohydrolase catalytic domain-containing protein, partial [Paracoccaceae bacterium]
MKPRGSDHHLLRGAPVRTRILDDVAAYLSRQITIGKLVSISIGDVPEVAVYIRNQAKLAQKLGLPFDQEFWSGDVTQQDCKARIQAMNDDPSVLGIILQRPVPDHIHIRSLQSAIHPLKDIEGMNPASIGNIVYND